MFDFYLEPSVNSKTRRSRTKGTQIQYKLDETTTIKNLKTFGFVSHVKTKQD